MFNIPIQAMRDALRPVLGDRGAREIIISDLGRGILRSQCRAFSGSNASRLLGTSLPDQAEDLDLPLNFWSPRFADEGEQHVSDPSNSVNFRADWPAGNFSVSGTLARGRDSFVRAAFDVHLDRVSAMARLAALNIDATSLKAIPATPESEMLAWLVGRLRTHPMMSQNAAEAALKAQFPEARRPLQRELYKRAKLQIQPPA